LQPAARVLDVVDETLALAAARHRLGLETADSLGALAIADDLNIDDLEPIFGKLCRDLGQPLPTLEQARRTVTRAILQDIIDETIAPEAGLAHLVQGVTPWNDDPPDT
jgi:hypothetical protein